MKGSCLLRIKPSMHHLYRLFFTQTLRVGWAHFAALSMTGPFHQILRCSESYWLKRGHQDLVELKCCIQNGKKFGTLHEFACHPCAGAMLIFSVSFQFQYMCYVSNTSLFWIKQSIYLAKIESFQPCGIYSNLPPGARRDREYHLFLLTHAYIYSKSTFFYLQALNYASGK